MTFDVQLDVTFVLTMPPERTVISSKEDLAVFDALSFLPKIDLDFPCQFADVMEPLKLNGQFRIPVAGDLDVEVMPVEVPRLFELILMLGNAGPLLKLCYN